MYRVATQLNSIKTMIVSSFSGKSLSQAKVEMYIEYVMQPSNDHLCNGDTVHTGTFLKAPFI